MRLSRLQKTILRLAFQRAAFQGGGRYLNAAPIKAAYYGFPLQPRGQKLLFRKGEIGRARYNNAAVAISRAFDHLARKGLVSRTYGRGVLLTGEGMAIAERLNDEFLRVTMEAGEGHNGKKQEQAANYPGLRTAISGNSPKI